MESKEKNESQYYPRGELPFFFNFLSLDMLFTLKRCHTKNVYLVLCLFRVFFFFSLLLSLLLNSLFFLNVTSISPECDNSQSHYFIVFAGKFSAGPFVQIMF